VIFLYAQQIHLPNLKTVLMVEDALSKMDASVITVAKLKKILPKQVNHNTLLAILSYLEASNKITVSVKGISWIANDNAELKKAISLGTEL
jgi:hypothetical protein